jgi:hypothetical protein
VAQDRGQRRVLENKVRNFRFSLKHSKDKIAPVHAMKASEIVEV